MPIYAYRCDACGFAKDVLQKVSDAVLTQCPTCLKESFKKQITAAGFQLKGTGWYVTDFRNGASTTAAKSGAESSGNAESAKSTDAAPATDSAAPAKASATPSTAASTTPPSTSST